MSRAAIARATGHLGLTIGLLLVLAGAAQALTGAIYTTDVSCTGVNVNQFPSKEAVYLDGGPQGGGSGLPDGFYYVKVTEPDGTLLATSVTVTPPGDLAVSVVNGSFVECYQLIAVVRRASSPGTGAADGYDDTTNGGGEYKVWVSKDPNFANNESKTDNFKVQTEECTERCGPIQTAIKACKFYDLDTDGSRGLNEVGITPWLMTLLDSTGLVTLAQGETDAIEGCVTFTGLEPGTYFVQEDEPAGWVQTGPQAGDPLHPVNPVGVVVAEDVTSLVDFGNVCLGAGGGKTKGFWQGPNGQAIFTADDLAAMVALHLRDAAGSDFDPADYAAFKAWIKSANAVNMAYMLSAQLAAMRLNVLHGLVAGGALVYAPDVDGSNPAGFISISELIALADAALTADGNTPDGDANREEQEDLKNALDDANNNLIFVQPDPESCPGGFTSVTGTSESSLNLATRSTSQNRGLHLGSGR